MDGSDNDGVEVKGKRVLARVEKRRLTETKRVNRSEFSASFSGIN